MKTSLDSLGEKTRRAVLKSLGGALGIATAGKASAHGWSYTEGGNAAETDGTTNTTDNRPESEGLSGNAEVFGYHSLGGEGSARTGGRASDPHFGGLTEIRVRDEYAYVTMFSARGESSGRGLAIVNIGDFLRAEDEEGLENAELSVESFFRNPNRGTAMMDVKVDDTGDFVFVGSQPLTALFDELSEDQELNLQDSSTAGANAGGLLAIDVSDKRRPELVDYADVFSTGVHNCFHHRINGDDYVFACKDINVGDAGLYIFEFDRDLGVLQLVNRVTATGGNNAQGELDPTGGLDFYCHDVNVQNDPKTGKPTLYLHYWDGGLMIFDASDPTDLEQIGLFPMYQAHFAVPAPDTITVNGEERRVAFASHEEPDVDSEDTREGKVNPGSSGTVYLVDTGDIYDKDGVVECGELANYAWQSEVEFANFELSPHNSDPAFHDGELWLHQSHYNGGTRFLKVDAGSQRGETVEDGDSPVVGDAGELVTAPDVYGDEGPMARENDATDWEFGEPSESTNLGSEADGDGEFTDFVRPIEDVPDDSKMEGLSPGQPLHWAAVQSRGVTFSSDINQGVFASKHDDIPLKGPIPFVEVERDVDLPGFTGNQANRVRLDIFADDDVIVRDRIPRTGDGGEDDWFIDSGDPHETYELGGQTAVEFDGTVRDEVLTYFVESPNGVEESGSATFGPVEFSDDGGDTWHAVSETLDSSVLAGIDVNDPASSLTLGTAAGLTGFTYTQREKLKERGDDLLDREE